MRWATVWAWVVLVTATGTARAEEEAVTPASGFRTSPVCPTPVPGCPVYPPGGYPGYPTPYPGQPATPDGPIIPDARPGGAADNLLNDRFSTPFTTQTGAGGYQGRSFNEEFDGDLGGGTFYRRTVQVGTRVEVRVIGTREEVVRDPQTGRPVIDPATGQPRVTVVPVTADVQVPVRQTVQVPIAGRYSGVLITDNDSPRPSDRLYFGYSYYDGVGADISPGFGGYSQNREIVGFEKTILDGYGSVGMRLPFVQVNGPFGTGRDSVGDLSVLFKYAPIFNRETGNVLAVGLVVTAPTGPENLFGEGPSLPHSVLLQPWTGFVRGFGRGYVQGITNLVVPTDGRDTMFLGNSLALGYRVWDGDPGRLIPAVVPTFETHVRTPFNNRSPDGLIYFPDMVNLTSGVHLRWKRLALSGAVSVPVVNPRPWNIEAIANVNFRF